MFPVTCDKQGLIRAQSWEGHGSQGHVCALLACPVLSSVRPCPGRGLTIPKSPLDGLAVNSRSSVLSDANQPHVR